MSQLKSFVINLQTAGILSFKTIGRTPRTHLSEPLWQSDFHERIHKAFMVSSLVCFESLKQKSCAGMHGSAKIREADEKKVVLNL